MASLIGSALAGLALAALAQPVATGFPCERLGEEIVSVHDGFADSAPSVSGPVPVRRNAVLFDRTADLIAHTYTLADQGAATADGTMDPIVFRKYRRGEQILFCTDTRRENLFGAADRETQYLLRCLVDGDGDAAYEAFTHGIQLVPINMRTGRVSTPPPEETPPILPLAAPVRLVEQPGLSGTNDAFRPRLRTRISVARLRGDTVELRFRGGVTRLPGRAGVTLISSGETVVAVPMTDGAEVPVAGTRVRFARTGRRWTATILDGFGREAHLHCSGAVVEAGETFTILTPAGEATYSRDRLQPDP